LSEEKNDKLRCKRETHISSCSMVLFDVGWQAALSDLHPKSPTILVAWHHR